jgi:hypothetical protein
MPSDTNSSLDLSQGELKTRGSHELTLLT